VFEIVHNEAFEKIGYFPEGYLAQWLYSKHKITDPIYAFEREGYKTTKKVRTFQKLLGKMRSKCRVRKRKP